eukprot:scaffold117781_cov28-Tisochrysis_lutea.AAC.2
MAASAAGVRGCIPNPPRRSLPALSGYGNNGNQQPRAVASSSSGLSVPSGQCIGSGVCTERESSPYVAVRLRVPAGVRACGTARTGAGSSCAPSPIVALPAMHT